ncbi:MAG: HesB/IscA family protein [Rhodothermales bacterium]
MELQITERALNKIMESAQSEQVDLENTMLRIAVVPGGCSGLTYDLGWDTTSMDQDDVQEIGDVKVVLDKRSYVYLTGSELDFSDGLDGRGFHFMNPQAVRNCACGESFGL